MMQPAPTLLGVAEMDTTHGEFQALVNLLSECDAIDFAGLFEKLLEHTKAHFANEGRLMRMSRFPALGEHEGEHHRVYADMLQMARLVRQGRLTLARAYVRDGLQEWFHLHLGTMDSALAAHLKQLKTSQSSLVGGLPVLN